METNRRSPVLLTFAIVAVVGLLGGLWLWLRPAPVAPGILFVGDSVTYMSTEQLDRELESDDPIVLARIGYRSSDLLPLFERDVQRRAKRSDGLRQVAILVGYNDVLKHQVESPALDRFMDVADRFDCAVWLELPSIPMRDREVARWNQRVKATARSHPNVHVVDDWRRAVDAAEPGELITRKDGVHPTKAGARRLADVYVEAVHRVC